MNRVLPFLTVLLILVPMPTAEAQRPGRGGQRGGPGAAGPPPQARNQENLGGANAQRGAANQGNQGFGLQNFANQNLPPVAELAQALIANFDADGSGELSQMELQGALTLLRDMMQNQAGGQQLNGFANQPNGNVNLQNGFGNQGIQAQRGQGFQANQGLGNRRPRGRGGVR